VAPRPPPIGDTSAGRAVKPKARTLSLRDIAEKTSPKGKRKGRRLSSSESRKIRSFGHRAERDLVKKLRARGFMAVRVPVSAPSSEPLPDVFATKGICILAFEVKSTSSDKIYFRQDQVGKLFSFLSMFKVYNERKAVLAAKFPYKWVFKVVDQIGDCVVHIVDESSEL